MYVPSTMILVNQLQCLRELDKERFWSLRFIPILKGYSIVFSNINIMAYINLPEPTSFEILNVRTLFDITRLMSNLNYKKITSQIIACFQTLRWYSILSNFFDNFKVHKLFDIDSLVLKTFSSFIVKTNVSAKL